MTFKDFCLGLIVRILLWSANALIVMWTWNGSVVHLIDVERASWVQALGLVLLVQFLRPVDVPERKKTS